MVASLVDLEEDLLNRATALWPDVWKLVTLKLKTRVDLKNESSGGKNR
jgi:hypothetical protein